MTVASASDLTWTEATLWGGVFLFGLAVVYLGARKYRISRIIRNTPPEQVRSVAVGRTELHGRAEDAGITYEQPFTDGVCLYRDWLIEERQEVKYRTDSGSTETEYRWRTIDSGTDVAPFYVADDTGRLLVDTTTEPYFDISNTNTTTRTVDPDESVPEAFAPFATEQERAGRFVSGLSAVAGAVSGLFDDDSGEDGSNETDSAAGDGHPHTAAGDGGGGATSRVGVENQPAVVSELGGVGSEGSLGRGTGVIATLKNWAVRWGRRFGYRAIQGIFTSDDDDRRRIATKRGPDQCRRRYRQAVLPVDEEVYVFGEVVPRADVERAAGNAERLQLERESALDVFIVSDRSEEGIVRHFSRWGPVYALAGIVVSAVGLAELLGGI